MAQKSQKGNPSRTVLRAASHDRGRKRKDGRIEASLEANKANRALIRAGQLTPWQAAQAKRAERRRNDPAVQQRRQARLTALEV